MHLNPRLILLVFLALEAAVAGYLYINWRDKEAQYTAGQAVSLQTAYRSSVNMYGLATEFVFDEITRNPEVMAAFREGVAATDEEAQAVARGRLYRLLYPTYAKLKSRNLRQLHFHLANGDSWLRFHDPAKFGDNLFEIRPSVRIANTDKKPVSGFEAGRVLSGFRYVFPILVGSEHLGSVETSVSFRAIRDGMAELEKSTEFAFVLRQDSIAHKLSADQVHLYGASSIHGEYLVEDPNLKLPDSPPPPSDTIQTLNARLQPRHEVREGMREGRTFTVTTDLDQDTWAVTFLPVRDVTGRQTAYVVAYAKAPLAAALGRDFLLSLAVSTLMLVVVGLLVWRLLKSRQALEAEKQSLKTVTDTVADGLYAMDGEGRITLLNPAAERLLGFSEAEVLNEVGHDLFHSHAVNDHLPIHACPIFRLVSRAEPFDGEEVFSRSDRSTLPVEVASRAVLENGRVTGSVTVFRDITERKRVEAALNEAKAAAELANRMKSEFLANMSHEIRTPMNGIIGLTQLALDEAQNPAQKEYLELVRQSADSLMTIINDILDFSKIEAGRLEIEHIPFSLRRTLENALAPLRLKAQEKGLELRLNVRDDAPDALLGDPVRLCQVVTNLVGNAVKFTANGSISVEASLSDEDEGDAAPILAFVIRDTGAGIPEDKLDAIFAAFTQADASITRRYGGTGLGLAIVRHLVSLMGGRVWVESTLGQGSAFHFTARLGLGEAPSREEIRETGQEAERPLHLLLVEDNAVNRKLAITLLEKAGHNVDVAEHGGQALERLLVPNIYDAVLLDVQMPVMDGIETARRLRLHEQAQGGHLPLIALTANAMVGDRERFLAAGMDDYLAKPIRVNELKAALARVARRN